MPALSALRDLSVFFSATLRQPGIVGAVTPSSRKLAERLTAVVPRTGAPTIVELGPGTGAFTGPIRHRLPAAGRYFGIEIDPELVAHLNRRYRGARVLVGDAVDLRSLLDDVGVSRVDAVVSGLPWSLFEEQQQRRILRQVCHTLAPGGAFSTFAYRHTASMTGARRFKALLHDHFDEVVDTRTVWMNCPPAGAYVCRRPIGATAGE